MYDTAVCVSSRLYVVERFHAAKCSTFTVTTLLEKFYVRMWGSPQTKIQSNSLSQREVVLTGIIPVICNCIH